MSDHDVRYGYQEGYIDNQDVIPDVIYRDFESTGNTVDNVAAPSHPMSDDVFDEHPSAYHTVVPSPMPRVQKHFMPHAIPLPAGGTPVIVAGNNPRRKTLTIWNIPANPAAPLTDAISISQYQSGVPAVVLPPGEPVVIAATCAVYANAVSASATLYVCEESYAS